MAKSRAQVVNPYAEAIWRTLGTPLVCRLGHLRPGSPAFGRNLREIETMVRQARADHLKELRRERVLGPLFTEEE